MNDPSPVTFRHSFGYRILLIVVGSFLISTVLVNLVVSRVIQQHWEQVLLQQQQEMSQMVVRRMDNAMSDRRDTLERMTRLLHDGETLRPLEQIQATMDNRIQLHQFFSGGMVLLDQNGRSIADSPVVAGRTGIDFSDREHVQQVARTRETVITAPLIGRGLQAPVFVINAPLLADDGRLLGFLFGVTRLAEDTFFQAIGSEAFGQQAELIVVDPQLRLVVSASDPALAMSHLPVGARPEVDRVLGGESLGFVRGAQGERLFFAAAQLTSQDWHVIHVLPHATMTEAGRRAIVTAAALVSLFMLLAMLVTWWLLRPQLASLNQASTAINQMAGGLRPLLPLPTHRQDEIGLLIASFNRLQSNLVRHIEQLERSNRDLQRLSKISAHHLMEPSRRLLIYSQQLRRQLGEQAEGELSTSLTFIEQSTRQLRNQIRDIQRYLDAGEPRGPLAWQAMGPIVQQVVGQLADRYPEACARARFEVGALPDAWIDQERAVELFSVLIENALLHAVPGQPVTIRIDGEAEPHEVRLSVSDDGPGIPEAYRERLVDLFERLDAQGEGTGIGLAIARHIVESLGGTLRLEASPMGGTRVTLAWRHPA